MDCGKLSFRTFLTEKEFEEARRIFSPPPIRPSEVSRSSQNQSQKFQSERPQNKIFQWQTQEGVGSSSLSNWLGKTLLDRLSSHKDWEKSKPIAIGSWAMGDLCPRSDIDLVFCGDLKSIKAIVEDFNLIGLKIRYRVPESLEDWTQGVNDEDVISLFMGCGLTAESDILLRNQRQRLQERIRFYRKKWYKSMLEERQARAKRFNSIANYLEPNIKYGKGGLRDILQTQLLFEIFPEKFQDSEDIKVFLGKYKTFLLYLRQTMHLNGLDEVMVASEQKILGESLGFAELKEFMREVQWALSESGFYSDWAFERVRLSQQKIKFYDDLNYGQLNKAVEDLKEDISYQRQERVRRFVDLNKVQMTDLAMGLLFKNLLRAWPQDHLLVGLFNSGLMQIFIKDLELVRGLVQHDQYHRYTVQTHLLQCMREVISLRSKPQKIGRLRQWMKDWNEEDWHILLLTALFHDLAKGKKGDHSTLGAQMVKKYFVKWKWPLRLTVEVAWMVKNHLLFSKAAFRRDPQDPKNWEDLYVKGVKGKRLFRLAVFTAIDIRGTNIEAWNDWKEKLLDQLVESVNSPRAGKYFRLIKSAGDKKVKISHEFLLSLDPTVVETVPTRILLKDYKELKSQKKELSPLIWQQEDGVSWVRFHKVKDEPGTFMGFAAKLFSAGCQVQESYVQTYTSYGVYDWFRIKTHKSPTQLKRLFELIAERNELSIPKIKFEKIDVALYHENQAIFSFRGKNKTGALLSASKALYDEGLDIVWARAHTWGRRLDDIFCVRLSEAEANRVLKTLRDKFQEALS